MNYMPEIVQNTKLKNTVINSQLVKIDSQLNFHCSKVEMFISGNVISIIRITIQII